MISLGATNSHPLVRTLVQYAKYTPLVTGVQTNETLYCNGSFSTILLQGVFLQTLYAYLRVHILVLTII